MSDWTDAAITKLQQLANEGYSASQIAALIHNELGLTFSRNAVIGKLHRLGRGVNGARKVSVAWSSRMIGALDTAMAEGLTLQATVRHVSAAAGQEIDPQHVHAKMEDIRARQERKERAEAREREAAARRLAKLSQPVCEPAPAPSRLVIAEHVAPVVPNEEPPTPIAGEPVTLMQLQWHHCRWDAGQGEDGQMLYCGATKAKGAYCREHARLAYVPIPKRTDKAPLPVYRTDKTFARFA